MSKRKELIKLWAVDKTLIIELYGDLSFSGLNRARKSRHPRIRAAAQRLIARAELSKFEKAERRALAQETCPAEDGCKQEQVEAMI